MSNTCEALDNANISPVGTKVKHTSTPLRTRRKTSRRDQGLDVHTVATSTPTPHRSPRLQRLRQDSPRLLNSPSSSIPCSQDGHPDVVWDFTSPKLTKGSRKRDLKITVQELLENLNQTQAVECDSKSSSYTKLLENWMSKQPAEQTIKEIKNQKNDVKKRSKRGVEKFKKFIESIQNSKSDNSPSHSKSPLEKNKNGDVSLLEQNTSFKNSFLEGGKSDDSSEELWGDADNSFIVKATQELDKVNAIPTTTRTGDVLSTIPETVPNPSISKNNSQTSEIELRKHSCEEHADILLHLSNIDWDGDNEWDNGFLLEDDDLSLVPDNVLSGETNTKEVEFNHNINGNGHSVVNTKVAASDEIRNIRVVKTKTERNSFLEEIEFAANCPNNELYNSFEDNNFEEESLLCQPEVLSRLDEVESMLSQPKCTPEEIKKKKAEALNRRKKTQLKRKN
ncbi:uncharacterized protein [Parasteatoda tepidariorum]|uniref:uncharacterized protein isoform X1 n=1 Tax=Parasteatoda tepidariorum TaxID=114398 RepID=UPI001C71D2EB|nr:uncharacterized protein LOC107446360 isoform X1 [Parasteatoda tepidariorum]